MMSLKFLVTILISFILFYIGKKSIGVMVARIGREREVAKTRVQYINTVLVLILLVIIVVAAGFIIGIGYEDVGLFFGSIFAVIGVALFAQWSILSNITASIIVFFFFPYKMGDYVRIIDDKNTVEGTIQEITLFHVILLAPDQSLTTYPNSMVFQKAVSINPKITALERDNNAQ